MVITEKLPVQKSSRLLWIIAIGVFVVSLASVIWAVVAHGVNVPYYDQWDMSWRIVLLFREGEVDFNYLIAHHNEHRILFTNLLTIVSAIVSNWDMRFEMWVSAFLCIANAVILGVIFRKHQPHPAPLALIVVSLLIVSVNQYNNLLWGFQTCWYLAVFFSLLTFLCLDTPKMTYRRLALASFFALCATFSLASGIFVWYVGLVGMWFVGIRQRGYYIFWIIGTVVASILFFSDYNVQSRSASLVWMIRYVPLYISGTLIPRDIFTFSLLYPFTITFLVMWRVGRNYIYLWRHGHKKVIGVWLMIGGLGLLVGVIASFRRPALDLAFGNRYITLASLFWVGVYGLILMTNGLIRQKTSISPKIRRLYWGNVAFIVIFLSIHIFTTLTIVPEIKDLGDTMRGYETCVLEYPTTNDIACLEGIYPPLDGSDYAPIPNRILDMQARGMGTFSGE